MSPSAFDAQMKRISDTFGEHHYTKERKMAVWKMVQNLKESQFAKIVSHMVISFPTNRPPFPLDFQTAVLAENRATPKNDWHDTDTPIECQDCHDSGVLYMREDQSSPIVFMACHCEVAARRSVKLPRWKKEYAEIFEKLPFNTKEWIPKFDPLRDDKNIIKSLAALWNAKIKFSVEYWENRKLEKNT